ncbi:MAG: tetraacyldisaccharide 4'-kinase [Bacteroidota bacterium]
MDHWRRLLLPFSLIFSIIIRIRNLLFDTGILKSESFPVITIGVGNLTAGGTGKTPHVEYIVRLLRGRFRLATLSRGYGRNTKGFMIAHEGSNASMIGDEPMQYFSKFDDIIVAVGEDRGEAIKRLLSITQPPEAILLDDNFQHRSVKAGLQILLVNYENFEQQDFLLPAGDLREPVSGARRADIIIVSKTPTILVPIERKRIIDRLKPEKNQLVYFSFYKYGEFHRLHERSSVGMMMGVDYYLEKRFTILLVTGIANPSGLSEYMRRHTSKLEMMSFPDHHIYTEKDLKKIRETFEQIANPNKIIVTTEKDAMRLRRPEIEHQVRQLPFFYLPIEVAFHQTESSFDKVVSDHANNNRRKTYHSH